MVKELKMRTILKPGEFEPTQKMKFTKTETEYNMKSLRFLLLTITSMFIVSNVNVCRGKDCQYLDYSTM